MITIFLQEHLESWIPEIQVIFIQDWNTFRMEMMSLELSVILKKTRMTFKERNY